jgi:hypothetical protein
MKSDLRQLCTDGPHTDELSQFVNPAPFVLSYLVCSAEVRNSSYGT